MRRVRINIYNATLSPAQGAMYAPLVLKFVFRKRLYCEPPTDFFLRALNQIANTTTTSGTSSQSRTGFDKGAIIGGALGGVAVLVAIGTIALLLWRRRRSASV